MMCLYVYTYHMAGRVSEEGGDAFNGTQKGTKFILSRLEDALRYKAH